MFSIYPSVSKKKRKKEEGEEEKNNNYQNNKNIKRCKVKMLSII